MTISQVDYSKKWWVMAAVGMGVFLATIDGSIVNVALPTLVDAFGSDFAVVEWVILAYLLTVTTLMIGMGRLADMIGKKSIYTLGFILFTGGSLLCGLASSIYWLIIFRVFQALGAAMIMALGMALITEAFPPRERGMAIGISGSMTSIGIVVGPTLGGYILAYLGWHWIFFVNLPVGVCGTLMVMKFVPSTLPIGKQRFDLWGASTLLLALLSFLIALSLGQEEGFTAPVVLLLFALAFVFLIFFFNAEKHAIHPMIDLRFFRNLHFSIGLITGMITFISIAGATLLMPFYLENVLGYPPSQVGLLMALVPVVLGVVSPISGVLSDRFGTRVIAVWGLLFLLIGYSALSTLRTNTTALGYLLRFLPVGLGMGTFQSPNNSAIMGVAPREHLGVVSGLLAISRTLGQTIGVALLGSIWARRALFYSHTDLPGGATAAPPAIQVHALQDTFRLVVLLVAVALALSIAALYSERRHSMPDTMRETD